MPFFVLKFYKEISNFHFDSASVWESILLKQCESLFASGRDVTEVPSSSNSPTAKMGEDLTDSQRPQETLSMATVGL